VSTLLRAADLRLPPGPVDLTSVDSGATPGVDAGKKSGKKSGKAALAALGEGLSDLQERLYAEGVADVGHGRSVLLVLQGMDTSGKGGTLRHTVGLVDPQGLRISSFKKPTAEELEHDFLWRIRKALPGKGIIGVFDRSHYEDVLIVRVHQLAPAEEIDQTTLAAHIKQLEQKIETTPEGSALDKEIWRLDHFKTVLQNLHGTALH